MSASLLYGCEVWGNVQNDIDSKFGVYYEVNPQISQPNYANMNFHEIERILLTCDRTGSHNLRIETGGHTNPTTPCEDRICKCGCDVQTLKHKQTKRKFV